jgi:D-sedoheptulose 7-phosphate isomerase
MSEFTKNLNLHIKILNKQKLELNNKINLFSEIIINTFNNGGKLMIVGNGGSAADAQHLSTELMVRMAKNRKALPVVALTTDTSAITATANDFNYKYVFSRQIEGLGNPNDLLLSISTSGNSENVIQAIKAAKKIKIKTLSLLGGNGGRAKNISDKIFIVNEKNPSRVQEIHIIFYHNMCQIIEDNFSKK